MPLNYNIFQLSAILILLFFYTIYMGKMILQRRKGIKTDQIARGKKSKELFSTEIVMKIATYSIVAVELLCVFMNMTLSYTPMRIAGAILGIIGVIIFGIAVYTMKDSWRAGIPESDKTELVTKGIFKISRNPAFLAFDLVYIGVLLMFFNWVLLAFTVWGVIMLHLQIMQEEKFLSRTFGEAYLRYQKCTKRYLGKRKTN